MCCMHQMFNACMHLNWFWRLMANLTSRKLEKWQKNKKKNGNSKIQKIRPTDNVLRKQYTKFHESRTFGCWDVMYLSFYERFLGNTQKMKNSKFQKIRPIQTAIKNLYPNFHWPIFRIKTCILRLMANLTCRKLVKWQKSLKFLGEKGLTWSNKQICVVCTKCLMHVCI